MTDLHNPLDPFFTFDLPRNPLQGAHEGVAAEFPYRWVFWRFWNVSKPYIVFVGLFPRSEKDPIQEQQIEGWMRRWEQDKPQHQWAAGGYVVVNLFGRLAWNIESLRRAHNTGLDIVGKRTTDAVMIFSRNPGCKMIVMLPGLDNAVDLREAHQATLLDALVGLATPIAIVGDDGMPERWQR